MAGYLVVWAGFSIVATWLQWLLELRGLVSSGMMAATSGVLGGMILLAAAIC
jgi:predicted metal-binding membrane protein